MSAGYRFAIQWVADNDEADDLDLDSVKYGLTIALVADMFNKTTEQVARAVIARRRKR